MYAAQRSRILAETKAILPVTPAASQLLVHFKEKSGKAHRSESWSATRYKAIEPMSFLSQVVCLYDMIVRIRPKVVHAHSYRAMLIAGVARIISYRRHRPLVVGEVHGVIAFESFFRNRRRLSRLPRFLALYALESLAAVLSDRLLLVSNSVRRYYPIVRLRPSLAIPRYVSPRDDESPTELDIRFQEFLLFRKRAAARNKRLIVYAGNADAWQMPERTVRLMSELVASGSYQGVVFTAETEVFRGYVDDCAQESEDWFVARLTPSQVLRALSLCDVGVVLREDMIINRVASPTKLFEYLFAGLAVLTTDALSIAKRLEADKGVAVVLPSRNIAKQGVNVDEIRHRLDKAITAAQSSNDIKQVVGWQSAQSQLIRFISLDED